MYVLDGGASYIDSNRLEAVIATRATPKFCASKWKALSEGKPWLLHIWAALVDMIQQLDISY